MLTEADLAVIQTNVKQGWCLSKDVALSLADDCCQHLSNLRALERQLDLNYMCDRVTLLSEVKAALRGAELEYLT
jgi:hypothetical protein